MEDSIRAKLLADPSIILDDTELMQSLLAASDVKLGANVVDLRHVAMHRLSHKLGKLEGTHQSVVAAAYQNLLGTKQIHQAVIELLRQSNLDEFVHSLKFDLLKILNVDCICILLEKSNETAEYSTPKYSNPNIQQVMPGFVNAYMTQGGDTESTKVKLRQANSSTNQLFESASTQIRSEGCVQLSFHENQTLGMIVFGSSNVNFFEPGQGTDLLNFFACVCEKVLGRWIS